MQVVPRSLSATSARAPLSSICRANVNRPYAYHSADTSLAMRKRLSGSRQSRWTSSVACDPRGSVRNPTPLLYTGWKFNTPEASSIGAAPEEKSAAHSAPPDHTQYLDNGSREEPRRKKTV